MLHLKTLAFVLLLAFLPAALSAHSLKDLERLLGDRERYFQLVDDPSPDFALQDPDGRPVRLSDLHGNVVVLHFIYAACPDVCPLHAERIAEVQSMINETSIKQQVRFVTITTDPRNDTPDVMKSYGERHGLDPANWVFLTTGAGHPDNMTRALAERFRHRFVKTESGYQVHGIVTHVIDKEGRWRANFHGLRFEPVNLVLFVSALVNDVQRPHAHEAQSGWDKVKRMLGL